MLLCYSVKPECWCLEEREEQLLLSLSTKELHLQLIQLLGICPAAPCFAFGSGGEKKGPTVQPASVYLIPYQAQLKTVCDAKE